MYLWGDACVPEGYVCTCERCVFCEQVSVCSCRVCLPVCVYLCTDVCNFVCLCVPVGYVFIRGVCMCRGAFLCRQVTVYSCGAVSAYLCLYLSIDICLYLWVDVCVSVGCVCTFPGESQLFIISESGV